MTRVFKYLAPCMKSNRAPRFMSMDGPACADSSNVPWSPCMGSGAFLPAFLRRRLHHSEHRAILKPVQNCGEEKRDHNLEMPGNVIALSAFHGGTADNVCERTIMGDKIHIHRREIAHGLF